MPTCPRTPSAALIAAGCNIAIALAVLVTFLLALPVVVVLSNVFLPTEGTCGAVGVPAEVLDLDAPRVLRLLDQARELSVPLDLLRQNRLDGLWNEDFRPLKSPIPPGDSPEVFQRWIESFSQASRVYWLSDESFLVMYFDKIGQEPHWRVAQMTRGGDLVFEGPSPKLLAVLSADRLLFDAPGVDEPNVWQFASVPRVR